MDAAQPTWFTENYSMKIRTESKFLYTVTPHPMQMRLDVSWMKTSKPDGPLYSPEMVQQPCLLHFRGECDYEHCADSHDPSKIQECPYAKECQLANYCPFRHDSNNKKDARTKFNCEEYKKKENKRQKENQETILEEMRNERKEKKKIYERFVYAADSLSLSTDGSEVAVYAQAMANVEELQKRHRPTAVTKFNYDTYFDELLTYISKYSIKDWSVEQARDFFIKAKCDRSTDSQEILQLFNVLFDVFQPKYTDWAYFVTLLELSDEQLITLMGGWLQFEGINELHIGGLFAGLLDNARDAQKRAVVNTFLQTVDRYSNIDKECSNFTTVVPDGCFILGMAKYLRKFPLSDVIQQYLKSKEKIAVETCQCETYVCKCKAVVDWDLYGVHIFRPIYDYSGMEISDFAELFVKGTRHTWSSDECSSILEVICDEQPKHKTIVIERKCMEMINSPDKRRKPFAKESKNIDYINPSDDELYTADCAIICGNNLDVVGDIQQCKTIISSGCETKMCKECCYDLGIKSCVVHMTTPEKCRPIDSVAHSFINGELYYYTQEDEQWEKDNIKIRVHRKYNNAEDFLKNFDAEKLELGDGKYVSDRILSNISKYMDLRVLEIVPENAGDVCLITDKGVEEIIKNCASLVKIKLVGCVKLTDKAAEHIFEKRDLKSIEISGALNLSGSLTNAGLEPLFSKRKFTSLQLLILKDQYHIDSHCIERLRRYFSAIIDGTKVIVGERQDKYFAAGLSKSILLKGCANAYTRPL